jgi:archaellin
MKKRVLIAILCCVLAACSSNESLTLSQISQYTGGQRTADTTSFFWYEENLSQPSRAADYVSSRTEEWYQSNYVWSDSQLREIVREGRQLYQGNLVSFRTQIRFDQDEGAIYQQYRVGGKVFPLNSEQIERYKSEAMAIASTTKKQSQQGINLIQGFWNGKHFEMCSGDVFSKIEFNQTLPSFVIDRLSDPDNYVAFLGSSHSNKIYIDELLILANDTNKCVERPQLIE